MTEQERFWLDAAGATPEVTERLAEAYGRSVDADEGNWRPLTANAQRDLPLLTQDRMLQIAHWLWEQNPLAYWIVEIKVAFLLAEGVKLVCADEENQAALDRFWADPINEMELRLPKMARELSLFGEQLYPVFSNEIDGSVRVSYIDPRLIAEVVKDPDNPAMKIGVVTKKDAEGRERRYRIVVNGPEAMFTQRTQALRASYTDGEAFFHQVNDLLAGSRGRSDLLPLADWLDTYEQFLFGMGENAKLLRALVWDLELKNATPETVTKRSKEFALPGAGGAYVHNDSEKLEPKVPKLEARDTGEGARIVRNHILGGAGLPEHWYGGGGDVNRAVGAEMGEPTFKLLQQRQSVLKAMLEQMGRYVLMKHAEKDGGQNAIDWSKPQWKVQAIFPELKSVDIAKYAQAVAQVVTGCAAAIDKGLMQDETAVKMIAVVAKILGVEIDAKEELARAKGELEARRTAEQTADTYETPPAAKDAEGAAADAAEAADKAAGAVKEALDVVQGWRESMESGMTRLAEAARERGASPDEFAAALRESIAAGTQNIDRLVEALGAHVTRHELELTLKHGDTKKTVTVAGKTYELVEKDATAA